MNVLGLLGEEELETSPYDDTLMDTRMASLMAGKHSDTQTHKQPVFDVGAHADDDKLSLPLLSGSVPVDSKNPSCYLV